MILTMVGSNIVDEKMLDEDHLCLNIGQRVECMGSYGTLKYIGEVPPTKGIWLGVDWDEPYRGKHNGTFEGKFYFSTRYSRSGSFVRSGKVKFGCDCVTAIHSRYGEVQGDETAGIDKSSLASVKKEMKAALFEVVGFDKVNKKQSQFDRLEVVNLKDELVNGAGPPGSLSKLCPRIKELDLSRNLLSCWESVAEITCQLPLLTTLTVSENRLTIPSDPASLKDAFIQLKHVVASRMEYTWSEVLTCCYMWPNLETLQIPFNNVSTINIPLSNCLINLKVLDLEGNCICEWKEVNKLGSLPSLESLNLSDTALTEISFPTEDLNQKTNLFPVLKQLYLSKNKISKWQSISELDKLEQLEELRFQENPLLEETDPDTSRQLIISRIGRLQKLNGIQILREERKGAEYDYLKKYGRNWLDINKEENKDKLVADFISVHPRYPALIQKHGEPEEGEVKIMTAALIKQLINVEISCPKAGSRIYKKKLPLNMPVQKLASLVQKLFKTGNDTLCLSYISAKNPNIKAPLDNDMKEIGFFSVEEGDCIIVDWN